MFVLHLTLRDASLNMWHIFRVTCSAMQSCRWTWNDTFPTASHAPARNRVFVDTIFWVNGQWENRWWPLWCCYCAFPSARQAGLGAKRCVGGAQNRHNTVLGPDHHSQATRCFQLPKNTPFWIIEIRSKNHFLSLISLINCLIVHFICSFIFSINWETPCFFGVHIIWLVWMFGHFTPTYLENPWLFRFLLIRVARFEIVIFIFLASPIFFFMWCITVPIFREWIPYSIKHIIVSFPFLQKIGWHVILIQVVFLQVFFIGHLFDNF